MGREACLLLLFEGACYLYEAANYMMLFKTILDSNVTDYSGGHCERATPDPIPNSEVKPLSADGTA